MSADAIYQHIKTITTEIGPRLATSVTERSLAYYVQHQLKNVGLGSRRQYFNAVERFSKRLAPQLVLSAVVIGTGLIPQGKSRWLSGGLGLGLFWHQRRIFQGYRTLWEDTLAERQSQNVIAKIESQGKTKNRVVLVAHLDTSFHRLSFHPKLIGITPAFLGGSGIATLLGSLLTSIQEKKVWAGQLRMLTAGYLMLNSLIVMLDEFSSPVVGANDNASGVAVTLELAAHFADNPLKNTEVWTVFTGSEEVGGAGLDAFLQEHGEELQDATFLVLDSVGAGKICWVTEHNMNAAMRYEPHPDAVRLAEAAAQNLPEYAIMGREMATFDEVAILNRYGLKAVSIMGYDPITGHPLNQHRDSDILENIDPVTLQTAAAFVREILRQVDA